MGILERLGIRKRIEEVVKETINTELDKYLRRELPKIMMKTFERTPKQDLTELGFNWALALYLQDIWPDVDMRDAVRWLREYIGVPYGHKDYAWNAAAAKLIAFEYASDFGERRS